jgi:glycosyltransferase involved in cell wall biosynthesis
MVARFVPENTVPEFLDAIPALAGRWPVVVVGSSGYGGALDDRVAGLASQHDNVRWLGHIEDDQLLSDLWEHAGAYFHGHSVGGTNPALVQAMASGAPVVALDTVFNREVLESAGKFVARDASAIAQAIAEVMNSSGIQESLSRVARLRAEDGFDWARVCSLYESALTSAIGEPR